MGPGLATEECDDKTVPTRVFCSGPPARSPRPPFCPGRHVPTSTARFRVAVIGVHGRGKDHMDRFGRKVVAICDCDRRVLAQRAEAFEQKYGQKLDQVVDFRELLDRDDIDAVSIATPNHTHALIAILAAQAGKHVYVEKPVSHSLWGGPAGGGRRGPLRPADPRPARRHDPAGRCSRRCGMSTTASWERSSTWSARATNPRPSIGKLDHPLPIPSQIDYDLWCGPAEKVDLYRPPLPLRLALGLQHRQRRYRQPRGASDGHRPHWLLGEAALSPRVVSFGGRFGYEDAGKHAQHVGDAARLSDRPVDLRDPRPAAR